MNKFTNNICHRKLYTMLARIVSDLSILASTSTMSSKHAAAVVCSKRVLSMANNYSLPAGHLVDLASQTKRHFGCHGHPPRSRQTPPCHSSMPRERSSLPPSRFTRESFESSYTCPPVVSTRCEKGPKVKGRNNA